MVMINLMAVASKRNVETEWLTLKNFAKKKTTTNSCSVCSVQMAQV